MRRWFAVLFSTLLVLSPGGIGAARATAGLAARSGAPPAAAPVRGDQLGPEIVGQRTRTSRTYLTNRGDYAVMVYPGSINYRDAHRTWQAIDNTLVPDATPGYAYQNKANAYTAHFPSDLGRAPIRIDTRAGWVEFALSGGSGSATVSGNTVTYGLSTDSVAYSAENEQVKETVILNGPSSPSSFVFTVKTSPGLTAEQNPSGGVGFVDAAGHLVSAFAPPSIQDSSHTSAGFSRAVSLTLSGTGPAQTVTVAANRAWLSDPARKWPVIIYSQTWPYPLTQITDTQGRTTSFMYNASGYVTQMTDPAGRAFKYAYDAANNLVSYTDPASTLTQYAYDANHELTQVTDPAGNVTKITYGQWGLTTSIVRVTNPSAGTGPTTSFTYYSGQTVVTDPSGRNTTYYYDQQTRVTSITDPESHAGQTSWTADNHVAQTTLPSGATTAHSYDAKNNPTKVTLPTNASATAQYGNTSFPYLPSSVTDAQGNTTSFQYNRQGLPTSVTDALQHTSTATHNANGTLASVTDANGDKTSYAYNTQGLLNQVTPPTPLGSDSYASTATTCLRVRPTERGRSAPTATMHWAG